jgi:hypothetical protein
MFDPALVPHAPFLKALLLLEGHGFSRASKTIFICHSSRP